MDFGLDSLWTCDGLREIMGFCIATAQSVGSKYPAFGSGVYLGLGTLLVDIFIQLLGTPPWFLL